MQGRRIRPAAALALALLAALLGAAGARAAHGPGSEPPTELERLIARGRPVYCGGGARRLVALTFDDGPGPYTRTLLRALQRAHAPATFFLVGNRIPLWTDAVRAEARRGALGNHTWSHSHLPVLSRRTVRRQLAWTSEAIDGATGSVIALFRPPYEQAGGRVDGIARSLGLLDVRWNVDAGDARAGARPAAVVRATVAGLRPGAIVLLHDAHPWTGRVARGIVAGARRRHLRPVTVPQLLALDPPQVEHACW